MRPKLLLSKPTRDWESGPGHLLWPQGGVLALRGELALDLWLGLLGAASDRFRVSRDLLRVPEADFQDF